MNDDLWLTGAVVFVCVALLVLFPGGRSVLAGVVMLLWKAAQGIGHVLTNQGQAIVMNLLRAHITVLRNFKPRGAVLPSVRSKTVRRD